MAKTNKTETQTIKANNRGYAYLNKLEGAPDFSEVKTAEFDYGPEGDKKVITVRLNKGEDDCGNMLRRGYVHIGADREATVEVKGSKLIIS